MSEAESSAGDEDYGQAAALYQEALDRNPRRSCLAPQKVQNSAPSSSGLPQLEQLFMATPSLALKPAFHRHTIPKGAIFCYPTMVL